MYGLTEIDYMLCLSLNSNFLIGKCISKITGRQMEKNITSKVKGSRVALDIAKNTNIWKSSIKLRGGFPMKQTTDFTIHNF